MKNSCSPSGQRARAGASFSQVVSVRRPHRKTQMLLQFRRQKEGGMSNSSYRLETSIKEHLAPILRADGFSGSGRCFRRVVQGLIQIVQLQGSRYGGSFAINLAIHPAGIPDVLGNVPDPAKMTAELCEFRRRMSESGTDQWWTHDASKESMDAAMLQAAGVYEATGRNLFAEQSRPDCPLLTLTPEQFESGQYRLSGFGATKVSMARAFALMRRSAGKLDHARAFAKIGLANVGSATGLRKELEELSVLA
jgi:hypothetical protein